MNHVSLLGRLTKDPEVKQTAGGNSVCSFTIAVDRKYKKADGTRDADFISCVGWRQVADIIGQYFHKGSRIGITGSIQTRSYDGQNGKVFITEVLVEEIEFIDKRSDDQKQTQTPPAPQAEAIAPNEEEYIDESLPFDIAGY
jgi:single-strand DNA-binding protein